jgi:hypothetical protein
LDDHNRKADASAPLKPSPKQHSEEEQKEYPDYYEDDLPRFHEIKKMDAPSSPNNVDFGAEHRTPGDGDFFPENPFRGNFPSDFEDFFKDSSFGSREEDRPVQQRTTVPPPRPTVPQQRPTVPQLTYSTAIPTAPPTAAPTVKPSKPAFVRTTEPPRQIPSQNVKTEGQKPHSGISIPGPVKQLTKLIQHSTNFRQRPNLQNHQREPSSHQEPAEPRPLIPERPRDRPQQSERPAAWSPSSNEQDSHHFNSKETIPTRINPPPVQSHSFNQPSGSSNLPFYQQNDRFGGVFNPNTIILESGFKPIRNADGPIPPLGFDVEPQQNVESKGISAEDPRVTSESPSLVTLDPVFVASEQDYRRPKEPVPITLPKAVVPVVPGPSAPVPRFPPHHEANQVNHLHPQQFRPNQTPPVQRQQQQQRPSHFNGQDANARPHTPPPSPPARKKSSGLAAFFNFGGNRRKEENTPPLATPIASGPAGPSPNHR